MSNGMSARDKIRQLAPAVAMEKRKVASRRL